ncbi:MAG: sulfatase-like hydrolase/transferase [Gammaproteobacteria bacterium]|nr:sulfatase-like hydrolase/transferase [Gammaproteobacteria bacterium]
MTTPLSSRYRLVAVIFVVAMLIFAITRTLLAFMSPVDAELDLSTVMAVYAGGLLYDIAFFGYALIPVNLYLLLLPERLWHSWANRWWVRLCCFAVIYGLLFIVVAEILFWLEFQVRFNFISVDYLVYRREVTNNILESYPVFTILFVLLFITAGIYRLAMPFIEQGLEQYESLRRRSVFALILWLLPLVSYVLLDSNLRDIPNNHYQKELLSNGPYQFFAAFRNNELEYSGFYFTLDDQQASMILRKEVLEANAHYSDNELFSIRRQIKNDKAVGDRLNIMLVMIESLNANALTHFGGKRRLTPYLDGLLQKSLSFDRFYAVGTRTTRGLEAVTLSIPPTPGRSIVKRLGRESDMWSLGNVLAAQGYDVAFHYGGFGYFDNMNAFFSGNGYRIVDRSSVPDEMIGFANAWGMSDEYLYTAALASADEAFVQGKPFFYHIMTTSNHRPYTYPSGRIDIPSGSGRHGAIKYTDWAIGDFIERARSKPWFDSTLFVFMSDHTAGSAGKMALPVRKYHIPFFIYSPRYIKAQHVDKIASQIDVAPTLLALLGVDYTSNFFGKDILSMRAEDERALIGNYQHLGLYTKGLLSIISPKKILSQQIKPEDKESLVIAADKDDISMQRALAYYQGGSYIYGHHLNQWVAPSNIKGVADPHD